VEVRQISKVERQYCTPAHIRTRLIRPDARRISYAEAKSSVRQAANAAAVGIAEAPVLDKDCA
jgi:hypothetical protein